MESSQQELQQQRKELSPQSEQELDEESLPTSPSTTQPSHLFRRIILICLYIVFDFEEEGFLTSTSVSLFAKKGIHNHYDKQKCHYGIALSSCEKYYKDIPKLLDDFATRKLPHQEILVVVGGTSEPGMAVHEASGAVIVNVTYMGFDVLPLQWIITNKYRFNLTHYWYLFHDTVRFHEQFFEKIDYIANRCCDTSIGPLGISLSLDQPMSMGFYNIEHLLEIQGDLQDAMEYSGNLKRGKQKAIDMEMGPYIHTDKTKWYLSRRHFQCVKEKPNGIELLRDWRGATMILHHFPDVDITKAQQNYGKFKGGPKFNRINWPALLPFINGWRETIRIKYEEEGTWDNPPQYICPAYENLKNQTQSQARTLLQILSID